MHGHGADIGRQGRGDFPSRSGRASGDEGDGVFPQVHSSSPGASMADPRFDFK
jgi:hypothetical protein